MSRIDPILEDKLNELYHLTNEIEEKNKKRIKLREELIPIIKKNKLETRKFAIGDRVIKYKVESHNESLTQKFLLKGLEEFFGPSNKDNALKCYRFILGKREKKAREMIDVARR